jgi:peptidoglycan/LPS O-acetylase OafA/YrhL
MLRSLQAGRAIAALVVVAFHLSIAFGDPRYGGRAIGETYTRHGHFGVDFFFVLSGFIILKAHAADIGRPAAWTTYLWRRFARIYPIYWIYLGAFCLLLIAGVGQVAHLPRDAAAWVSAFSLVPLSGDEPPLVVAWSLFNEIAFYGLFSLLILNRWAGAAALAAWALYCVPLHGQSWDQASAAWSAYTSPYDLDFLAGMAAYGLYRRGRNPRLLLAAGLLAGVAAFMLAERGDPFASWLFGGAFALLMAGATIAEAAGRLSSPSGLVALGNASYSLYLIHVPLIGALLKLTRASRLASVVPAAGVWWIVLLVTVAIAWVAWLTIERPLVSALRRRF